MPLNVRLPERIAREVERAAQEAGESVEAFVSRSIANEIERQRTDAFFAERRARADIARALAILDREGGEPPRPEDELPEGWGGGR